MEYPEDRTDPISEQRAQYETRILEGEESKNSFLGRLNHFGGFNFDVDYSVEESNKVIRQVVGELRVYLEAQTGRELEDLEYIENERINRMEFETADGFVEGYVSYDRPVPNFDVGTEPASISGELKLRPGEDKVTQLEVLGEEMEDIEEIFHSYLPER